LTMKRGPSAVTSNGKAPARVNGRQIGGQTNAVVRNGQELCHGRAPGAECRRYRVQAPATDQRIVVLGVDGHTEQRYEDQTGQDYS
jgi:hypothetical protein